MKLLFDELTGKSKGYAIINYGDNETASSAVRNLNYMTLPNGRFLKCSFVTDYDMSSKESVKLPPCHLGYKYILIRMHHRLYLLYYRILIPIRHYRY